MLNSNGVCSRSSKYEDIKDDFHLEDLPVTTKPQMMSNFDDVLTDRNITMSRIDEFTRDIEKF